MTACICSNETNGLEAEKELTIDDYADFIKVPDKNGHENKKPEQKELTPEEKMRKWEEHNLSNAKNALEEYTKKTGIGDINIGYVMQRLKEFSSATKEEDVFALYTKIFKEVIAKVAKYTAFNIAKTVSVKESERRDDSAKGLYTLDKHVEIYKKNVSELNDIFKKIITDMHPGFVKTYNKVIDFGGMTYEEIDVLNSQTIQSADGLTTGEYNMLACKYATEVKDYRTLNPNGDLVQFFKQKFEDLKKTFESEDMKTVFATHDEEMLYRLNATVNLYRVIKETADEEKHFNAQKATELGVLANDFITK
ncbi:MAG: hypothetical protein MJ072_03435 [Clostridia bacterium]|nr:hypothetical protein [Clostridia bacterium]